MTTQLNSIERLNALVEQKVQQGIVPVLFEKLKNIHAKYGYKSVCGCDYCMLKRAVVANIGGGYYSKSRERRDSVIIKYRIKLNELLEDL